MYQYQEYPKCLYRGSETLTVQAGDEEEAAKADGWLTAEEFHSGPAPAPAAPPAKKEGKKKKDSDE